VIGLFPATLLSRMTPSVESVLDQYQSKRGAWLQMTPEVTQARLLPRRGGPLEEGYPEPPEKKDDASVAKRDADKEVK